MCLFGKSFLRSVPSLSEARLCRELYVQSRRPCFVWGPDGGILLTCNAHVE